MGRLLDGGLQLDRDDQQIAVAHVLDEFNLGSAVDRSLLRISRGCALGLLPPLTSPVW
jgi:hypothetical protein